MNKNAYRGHRFPPAIIQLTVWMYARFKTIGSVISPLERLTPLTTRKTEAIG